MNIKITSAPAWEWVVPTATDHYYDFSGDPITLIEPEEEKPEVCPEVHNTTPVDADRAMAAVRAMCAGGGR
jgi:hypothetical protein